MPNIVSNKIYLPLSQVGEDKHFSCQLSIYKLQNLQQVQRILELKSMLLPWNFLLSYTWKSQHTQWNNQHQKYTWKWLYAAEICHKPNSCIIVGGVVCMRACGGGAPACLLACATSYIVQVIPAHFICIL
jgi:hypothetical protein